MIGLSKGSSVVSAGGWMVSGSSAPCVDLRQQRTLRPAQTNRLSVTLIWRLNQIFLRFANPKDFESFCREGGIFVFKKKEKRSPEMSRAMDSECEQSGGGCQFIRQVTDQG